MESMTMHIRNNIFKPTLLFGLLASIHGTALATNTLNIADTGITDVSFKGTTVVREGHAGKSMASGDFNGDGIMDLAIGAPGMSSPRGVARVGNIFIYYGGSSSGVGVLSSEVAMESASSGTEDAMLYGALEKEAAGDFMTVGDFNGDGRDDLVIVAQRGLDGLGTTAITKIYVVYGSSTKLSGQLALSTLSTTSGKGVLIQGSSGTPAFQVSALTAGNLINDAADELVFSDTRNNTFHVLAGEVGKTWNSPFALSQSTIKLTHSLDTNPKISSAYFPLYNQPEIAGVAIGDYNNDGKNDLALGVPNETVNSITNAGQVYVIFNSKLTSGDLTLDTIADIKIFGGKTKDKIGGPLATGDFNHDGISDLMIGEPQSQRGNTNATGLGQVQVVYGSSSLASTVDLFDQADITLHLSGNGGVNDVGRIGFRTGKVLLAEDVNGDGIDDMTISSPYAFFTRSENGWVHVVYGGTNLSSTYELDKDADLWVRTPEPTDDLAAGNMGEALAIGDFDADGNPDFALAAPKGRISNGGWVSLLSNPDTKVGCSGEDASVESRFALRATPYVCEGAKTLVTRGDVVVENGAIVEFYSPSVTLNRGFRVEKGGIFRVNQARTG